MGINVREVLGDQAEFLLGHECKTVERGQLNLPGPDYVDRVLVQSDRPIPVLRNLQQMFDHGRLAGTGYLSILPVDQGIEHSAAASFSKNPAYFDPLNLAELAYRGGVQRLRLDPRWACHRRPTLCPQDPAHREAQPQRAPHLPEPRRPGALRLGPTGGRPRRLGVGATIYFGSEESTRQIREVSELFAEAHHHGLFTVLWCYLRNPAFKTPEADYHLAADLTGQANHLGVTIEADIIKQKLPENNGGYTALKFGRTDPLVYSELTTDHPIDLTRWQVVNCYAGRIGLINSGGESSGSGDFRRRRPHGGHQQACRRHGPDLGRKAFQRPMSDGVAIIKAVQDVYLDDSVTVA